VTDFLTSEMVDASARQEYELAAKLRDRLTAARRAMESQEMVLTQPEDLDVIGLVEDDLEAAFQAFFVRRGRVMGRKGWIVDRVEELDRPGLLASFVRELYMERDEVPPRILLPQLPADEGILRTWLSEMRAGPVRFAVAERGAKRRLSEVVARNAADAFQRHKLRRSSDFGARSRALSRLSEELGLPTAPLRIECYDVSNLGATDKVGSMVVFEDGLPKRSDYRRFEIKGVPGQDDFASMEEMLRRRFTRLKRESTVDGASDASAASGDASGATSGASGAGGAGQGDGARTEEPRRRRRFAYPPALVVVDGGRGQLAVATKVLDELELEIPAVGLAKRLEEVYEPGKPDPIRIPRASEALFVLQHLRDEAHRFAITYHREKRGRRALASPLDDVPGVGPTRKRALLRRFGSLTRLREAGADEIADTPGVGRALAEQIHERLHAPVGDAPPAVGRPASATRRASA
jgi:excinuclease ABC subunit C